MTHSIHHWGAPPDVLRLLDDEVHVWYADLERLKPRLPALLQVLSPKEREHAQRYRRTEDQAQYAIGHGLLRVILGRYLSVAAERLEFGRGPHGKPYLAWPVAASLRFNMAHSRACALYALARGRELGVDVEYVRPDFAYEEIVPQFFAPAEIAALQALPVEVRRHAFFICWTRKEAYIKAQGMGLYLPLDQFAIPFIAGQQPMLSLSADEAGEAARWSVRDLYPASGYAAALVAEGHGYRISLWRWQDV